MQTIPIEIANFLTAMQAGRAGADALAALFAEDAVYVEPFSGTARQHQGRAAVMAAMASGWDHPMPDIRIAIDKAETRGSRIEILWSCYSPALPGGKGQGRNSYLLENGQIKELVTTLEQR